MNTRTILLLTILLVAPLAGCANAPTGSPTPATEPTPTPMPQTPVVGVATAENFEDADVGGVPTGWTVIAGNWSVIENTSAPDGEKVLLSDQTALGETAILNDAAGEWSDLEASVQFNVLAGEKGQAGGILFRYADAKNYYVVRYNHNELSWNLFRTLDGKREKFEPTEAATESFQGALHQWTDMRVVAKGDHIVVTSGNVTVIDYTETVANAPKSGKVGLWTRWDSKTEFDAFTVKGA